MNKTLRSVILLLVEGLEIPLIWYILRVSCIFIIESAHTTNLILNHKSVYVFWGLTVYFPSRLTLIIQINHGTGLGGFPVGVDAFYGIQRWKPTDLSTTVSFWDCGPMKSKTICGITIPWRMSMKVLWRFLNLKQKIGEPMVFQMDKSTNIGVATILRETPGEDIRISMPWNLMSKIIKRVITKGKQDFYTTSLKFLIFFDNTV